MLLASCGNWILIPDEPDTDTGSEASQDINDTFDYESFIGLSEDDAIALWNQNNIPVRTTKRDGESLMVTQDFNPWRVNITVRNDTVVNYSIKWEY